jgi:hypothetical protein
MPIAPERWRRVEELYHAALAREARARPLLPGDACTGDAASRRDVEWPLAEPGSAEVFLREPAVVMAAAS